MLILGCACRWALSLSHVHLFVTSWTVIRLAPLSLVYSHWRELSFPSPGDFPDPGIEPTSPVSPALASGFFTTEPSRKSNIWVSGLKDKEKLSMLALRHFCKSTVWGTSLVAQMVKNLPAVQETQVWSLGQEDPLEWGMATHSSIVAWRILWMEEPGRLQSTGSQRVGHDWITNTHTHTHTVIPKFKSFFFYIIK